MEFEDETLEADTCGRRIPFFPVKCKLHFTPDFD